MFTQQELNVLFHIMNNSWGDCFESAKERAMEVDAMTSEEFIRVYSMLVNKLANMETE